MMSAKRYSFLMENQSESLTLQEYEEGWHFCWDWDGLLIHKDDVEFSCCSCQSGEFIRRKHEKRNLFLASSLGIFLFVTFLCWLYIRFYG